MQEAWVWSLGWVGVTVCGVAKSWTHWATNTHTHTHTILQIVNLHIFLHIRLLLFEKWENVGVLGMVSIFWDSRGQRTWFLRWSWGRCRRLQFFLVCLFFVFLCSVFLLVCWMVCFTIHISLENEAFGLQTVYSYQKRHKPGKIR